MTRDEENHLLSQLPEVRVATERVLRLAVKMVDVGLNAPLHVEIENAVWSLRSITGEARLKLRENGNG
jgi:hypothetical protein